MAVGGDSRLLSPRGGYPLGWFAVYDPIHPSSTDPFFRPASVPTLQPVRRTLAGIPRRHPLFRPQFGCPSLEWRGKELPEAHKSLRTLKITGFTFDLSLISPFTRINFVTTVDPDVTSWFRISSGRMEVAYQVKTVMLPRVPPKR